MKKRILLLLIPAFLFISCGKDFTTLSPISQRNVASFYKSESDFRTAVNGAYDALQLNGTYGKNYVLMFEMRSDNTANGGGASGLAASLEAIDQFNIITTAEEPEQTWSDSYKGISRCNLILSRIDDATFSQDLKDQYKGEALFIRSLLYYDMAVIFGNIPKQTGETTSPNDPINQVGADEIYAMISEDLNTAAGLLPSSYSGDNVGRATSWAAKSLLGKVLLTMGNKTEAATVLQDVVDNGPYSLVADYADLWGPSNENNSESIFEVQFKAGGIGEGSGYTDMFTPLGTSGGVGGGNAPQQVTTDVYNSYEATDQRLSDSIVDTAANPANYWVLKYASSPFGPLDADNNWYVLRYADVLLMLAEAVGEPNGYQYINQVRSRAGLGPIGAADPGTYEEKLLQERRAEFAFEGQRWPDLLRFGMAKQVMAAQLGKSQDDINLLYPIPQREIDVAPDQMQQNPGY
ncbi:MAG: RagB/SusD family nutrient uptake outer membrane protein [Balneolaceae bacterium]|jgi:hypothetical protein